MEEATVLQWRKSEGDDVTKGDPLAEIETDKATWIVEAEQSGQLLRIVVSDGGVAPVGAVIGLIGEPGEAPPEAPAQATGSASAEATEGREPAHPLESPVLAVADRPAGDGRRARATPVARRAAADLGVRLDGIVGTGPGGRIVRQDVLASTSAEASPGLDRGVGTSLELTPTQRTIARRMAEATGIPHFALDIDIDMEAAVSLRGDFKELTADDVPSVNDLVVKAVGLALRDFPALNASFEGETIVRWPRINVGIAVAMEDSLLVPVMFDADKKPLRQIARETRELVRRAHEKALTPAELNGGTFTVSNLGMFGIRSFAAVINPPQAAILAVGEVSQRPVGDGSGALAVAYRMDVTLSCDHRVVYGAEGARFLARARELLERPVALTL